MKTLHLLSTAAAALLLTAGVASAQVMKKDEAPARAPAAERNVPAEKIAPSLKTGKRAIPETTGQATPQAPVLDKKHLNAEPTPKGVAPHAEMNGSVNGKAELKANEGHRAAETHGMPPVGKSAADKKRSTTGQGAAAGSAKLSTEQRTKLTTIFHRHHVAPTRLNVSIRVGTRLPETVHFYPVPVEVVDVYPEWRGYDYILVGNEILIVDPGTHEIVAVLEA